MKKAILSVLLLLGVVVSYAVISKAARRNAEPPTLSRHEERAERRAARQAAEERAIDSMVLAHSFRFLPSSAQVQPAGRMFMIANPNYEVSINDDIADVFLPYFKGIAPPLRHVTINTTVVDMSNYISTQTENGWTVTFQSSLFSASDFTFDLEINSKFGTAILNLKNTFQSTVQYNGTILGYY